jgi:cytochrome c5
MNGRLLSGALCSSALMFLVACSGGQGAADNASTPSSPAAGAKPSTPESPAIAAAPAAPSPGEKTYQGTCVMCHGNSAVGAPVLGNKADWEPRIAQGKDVLYLHALEGFSGQKGAMPARGGNPSLDDAAVKAAVDYMVGRVK